MNTVKLLSESNFKVPKSSRLFKLFSILLISIISLSGSNTAPEKLTVGDIVAEPGTKVSGNLIIEAGVDEGTFIPITIINGSKPGPVLTLIAGIHGTEYAPVIVLQKIVPKIDPQKLSGSVIIVHVANIQSFKKRTVYFHPVDNKNLNRQFPGKKDGTVTERIAYAITEDIIEQSDYLIDMHGGEFHQCCVDYGYIYYNCPDEKLCEASNILSNAFGYDHLIPEDYYLVPDKAKPMYCEIAALRKGVAAIGVELGDMGEVKLSEVKFGVTGVLNVMYALKMLEGEIKKNDNPIYLKDYNIIKSKNDGIFYTQVECGQTVAKNKLLGYTTDYFGNIIEEFYAPFNGFVVWSYQTPAVNVGDGVFWVAKAESDFK